MRIRDIFTWYGNPCLNFLMWRDDLDGYSLFSCLLYYLLFLPACAAMALMVTADMFDGLAVMFDNMIERLK